MEYWIGPASVRLDARRPDHLAPLLGLLSNVLAEVAGRTWKHSAAKVGKPRVHLGVCEGRVDLLVELVEDLGRRALGGADAEPETRFARARPAVRAPRAAMPPRRREPR
jgi:hypothetical protein